MHQKTIEIEGRSFTYREPGALDYQCMMAGGLDLETGKPDNEKTFASMFRYAMLKLVKDPVLQEDDLLDPGQATALVKLFGIVMAPVNALVEQKKS